MSFDALAPHYRWLEALLAGEKLQDCRLAFLGRIARPDRVLILGEGNGRFLAVCRRRFPEAKITCVDASARMLACARDRLERQGLSGQGIELVQADARRWPAPPATFDLIVTHFFLDCFAREELGELAAKLARAATGSASWLLADFAMPAAGFRRVRAQVIHLAMYAFFRAAARIPARKLSNPDSCLAAGGFSLRERQVREWGLLHTDWWGRGF